MMRWFRKVCQFLGLVYRDDGTWRIGPGEEGALRMVRNRAPWWERGMPAKGTLFLAALWAFLAVLNFGLAFGGVIAKLLWRSSFPYLIVSIIFLVLAIARRRRAGKERSSVD